MIYLLDMDHVHQSSTDFKLYQFLCGQACGMLWGGSLVTHSSQVVFADNLSVRCLKA